MDAAVMRAGEVTRITCVTTVRWVALCLACAWPWWSYAADPEQLNTSASRQLNGLIDEAVADNPEIAAARSELEAARQRIPVSGALDDPMLEAGIVNAPLPSLDLNKIDMTMKMLGLAQKFPFPGKRDLRRAVASADATSLEYAVQETQNRIVRDVRVAYAGLAANQESQRIIDRTQQALQQLAAIAKARYHVGEAQQVDVLDAQTELGKLAVDRQKLVRDEVALQSDLRRLLGRTAVQGDLRTPPPALTDNPLPAAVIEPDAGQNRPEILALQAVVDRNAKSIDLAEREFYPDFDVRLQYGQRDSAPDGMPRDDLVTLTVAVNLPIWRKSRLEPQVAEARAMRNQAQSMLEAQRLETQASLEAQRSAARQWSETARTYQTTLIPEAQASVASALAAYRVGNVEFLTLRQAQLREYDLSLQYADAIANYNKALAEIDLLSGRGKP